MKTFDVQSIEIEAPFAKVFAYVSEANNLPEWTSAFKKVSDGRALIQTPRGSVEVALTVNSSREHGTVDWVMTFPDGKVARAYSRIVDVGKDHSILIFILMAPPVPLEQLEGALGEQSQILREELSRLWVNLSQ